MLAAVDTFSKRSGGRLDLLFNNAGIDAKGPFVAMGWDQIMAVVNVTSSPPMVLAPPTSCPASSKPGCCRRS